MKQNKEIDWLIAGKILSGEANAMEMQNFEECLKNAENRKKWDDFHAALNKIDYSMISERVDVEKAWKNVNKTTKPFNNKKIILSFVAAACVLIAFIISPTLFKREETHVLRTTDSKNSIELKDGSLININRFSTLQYPNHFESDYRTVNLNGEAFFEIKRDEKRPFIIQTSKLQVKVLGTSFNVRAYPENKTQVVTVKSGIVEVCEIDNIENKITLHPGDKAVYNTLENGIKKQTVKNENYLAWKTGKINFKDEQLKDVIKTIEEVYDININIPVNTNLNALYTAHFDNTTVEKIIYTINTTLNIDLQFE